MAAQTIELVDDVLAAAVLPQIERIEVKQSSDANRTNENRTTSECSSVGDEELDDLLKDENYWLFCALCFKKFPTKALLDVHMVEHGSTKNVCKICDKVLLSRKNLKIHMGIHSGEKNFICEVCGQRFRLQSFLNKHKLTHLPKAHTCDKCGKRFAHPTRLSVHKKLTHGDRKFQCDTCGKLFSQKPHLKTHMYVHKGRKDFVCYICDKEFLTKANLDAHFHVHTGERKYVCKVCGKGFPIKGRLKAHMLVHSEDRPYRCNVCGKQFRNKGNVDIHMRRHYTVDEKSAQGLRAILGNAEDVDVGDDCFSCGDCGAFFKSFNRLENHMLCHENDGSFRPEVSREVSLKASRAGKEYRCDKCGNIFANRNSLSTHLKSVHSVVRRYQCSVCDKAFTRKNYLDLHMVVHTGEKKHKCEECGKSFTQRSSLNTHLNLHRDSIQCGECGKTFGRKAHLQRHIEQSHVKVKSNSLDPFQDESNGSSDLGQLSKMSNENIVLEETDVISSGEMEDFCILVEIDSEGEQSNVVAQSVVGS